MVVLVEYKGFALDVFRTQALSIQKGSIARLEVTYVDLKITMQDRTKQGEK